MSDHHFVLIRKELLATAFACSKDSIDPVEMEEIAKILETDAANLDRLIGDAMAAQLIDGVNYIGYTYDVSVAGQDVCDVTVTFTKKDGKTAHDFRLEAEAEVTRLKKALLIPGTMRCAKCAYRVLHQNMNARTGTISAAEAKPEQCPNGCGPLWPVTWEEDLRAEWANQEQAWASLTAQRDFAVSLLKRASEQLGTLDEVLEDTERGYMKQIAAGVGIDEVYKRSLQSIAEQDATE